MLFDFFFKSNEPQPLPFHTDMHCHIVPGVDDGSPDVETSLQLLENMAKWGINRVFASPHSTQDRYENTPQSLAEPFKQLTDAAKERKLPIELHHHMEYRIDEFFLDQLEANNVVTMPDNLILIENSFAIEPWGIEGLVYDIISRGFTPVLAHPERYSYYSQRRRQRYAELKDLGMYLQVNLLSLSGYYGKLERDTAVYLLKNRLAQFIGTDIHRMSHVESITSYLSSRQYQRDATLFDHIINDTL